MSWGITTEKLMDFQFWAKVWLVKMLRWSSMIVPLAERSIMCADIGTVDMIMLNLIRLVWVGIFNFESNYLWPMMIFGCHWCMVMVSQGKSAADSEVIAFTCLIESLIHCLNPTSSNIQLSAWDWAYDDEEGMITLPNKRQRNPDFSGAWISEMRKWMPDIVQKPLFLYLPYGHFVFLNIFFPS